MTSAFSLRQRVERLEATIRPAGKPWRDVYAFEHDPCLDVPEPWKDEYNTIIEIFVSPGGQTLTNAERAEMGVGIDPAYYGTAIEIWEREHVAGSTQKASR